MKRNNFLDVLKGICILIVIFTHFEWSDVQRARLLFPFWVNPAVPVFMIISGYVCTESYKRKNETKIGQVYNVNGIAEKILRYTLPFAIIFIAEAALKITIYNKRYPIGYLIYRFIIGGWGPGSYYYPYMIQFIFLFPIVYLIIQKWDFKGLLCCGLLNLLYEAAKSLMNMPEANYRLIVLRYIFAMAIGCYFSIGKFKIRKWMGVSSFVIGVVYILAICYFGCKAGIFKYWTRTSMPTILYVAPLVYLLIKKCTLECKPLEYLGRASYSIYLIQMIYFHFLSRIFNGIPASPGTMLATYAICITAGLLYYNVIQYIMSFGRKTSGATTAINSLK